MSTFQEEMSLFAKSVRSKEDELVLWLENLHLEDLSIPKSFLPKICQNLPRQKDSPHLYREEFSDIHLIKKKILEKLFLPLYIATPAFLAKKIVLFTLVLEDGLGDIVASNQVRDLLNEKGFKRVEQIFLMPEKYRGVAEGMRTSFCYYYNKNTLHFSFFDHDLIEIMKKADMLFQLPTFYPFWQELITYLSPKCFFSLAEYGFMNSSWIAPCNDKALSLGLHFLEQGIFIRNGVDRLVRKKHLEERISPNLSWQEFKKHFDFCFAYTKNEEGLFLFLSLALARFLNIERPLVIAVPDASSFVSIASKQNLQLLFSQVSELRIRLKTEDYRIPLRDKGRVVEIVELGQLNDEEMLFLYQNSKKLSGCRGNQSFSEVISLESVFFYDPALHSQPFLMDLSAIALSRLGSFPCAGQYVRGFLDFYYHRHDAQELSFIAKQMSHYISHPSTTKGLLFLSRILKEEYCANDLIYHQVLRQLAFSENHHVKMKEKSIIKDIIEKGGVINNVNMTN